MIDPNHKLQLRSVRLEALGDGIFAVAMTILAIELKWPHLDDTSLNAFTQSLLENITRLILLRDKFYCAWYYVVWS